MAVKRRILKRGEKLGKPGRKPKPKVAKAEATAEPAPARPRGRPKFEPTDKMRGEVEALSATGFTQSQISEYTGIAPKTLRKHFRRELDFANMKLLSGAANALGRLALGTPDIKDEQGHVLKKGEPPNVAACIFLLKVKGKEQGWTERQEVTGAEGGPINVILKGDDAKL